MGQESGEVQVKSATKCCGVSRKKCIVISVVMGVLAAVAIGVGVYFGIYAKATQGQVLKVGQTSSATGTLSRRGLDKRAVTRPNSLVGSTSAFNFAEVVGIKMNVIKVTITPSDTSKEVASISFEGTEGFVFGSGETERGVSKNANIAPGTYNRVEVQLKNSYKLKAYCLTNTSFVYTTASGIKAVSLSSVTGTNNAPSDFDYYSYPFAWPAIAKSATDASQNTEQTSLVTYSTFTVTANSKINILVDTNYVVSCYDGTEASTSTSNNPRVISPFSNGPSNSGIPITTFFPTSSPKFGLLGVPLYVYIGDDSSLVKAETYIVGSTNTPGSKSVDPTKVLAVTLAYGPTGELLGVKGRSGSNDANAVPLENDFTGAKESDGTYTLNAGAYSTTSMRVIANRKVTAFSRSTDSTVKTFSVSGGADCGQSFVDNIGGMSHQRSRSCPGSSINTYWTRIK